LCEITGFPIRLYFQVFAHPRIVKALDVIDDIGAELQLMFANDDD
jgi:hypothetical protein